MAWVMNTKKFTRRVHFTPGYDHRHETPNYGQHPMMLAFVLVGEKGAMIFDINTGWYPDPTQRLAPRIWGCYAHHHLDHNPLAEEHTINDHCDWLGGSACIGSQIFSSISDTGEKLFDAFIRGGEDALWPLLEELYTKEM